MAKRSPILLVCVALALSGCGGKAGPKPAAPAGGASPAATARLQVDWNKDFHIVLEENAFNVQDLGSAALNKNGLLLYQKQDYVGAYILFRQATLADPKNANAWYNRACMLAVLRAQNAVVDENELFEALEKALTMDRRYQAAFTADADLAQLRDHPRFIALTERYAIDVYALNGGHKLGYWKNAQWVGLPDEGKGERATCLTVGDADVYVGGYRANGKDHFDDIQAPGYWKNGSWTGLPAAGTLSLVKRLVIDGADVYAGGWRSGSGILIRASYMYKFSPGYWKNGSWNAFPPTNDPSLSPADESGKVLALAVADGSVYGSGLINNYENYGISVLGYWKDGGFLPVEPPVSGGGGELDCLIISGGDIYLAGGGTGWCGYWKDDDYVPLSLQDGREMSVNFLAVSGQDVYAASMAAGAGYWKDGAWVALPLQEGKTGATVTALAVLESAVCVAGNQERAVSLGGDAGGDIYYSTGYWLNGRWVALSEPDQGESGGISSLVLGGPKNGGQR